MVFDIVIRNGRIIDGTGNPWYSADIGIQGGRIAEIARNPLMDAERFVEADGLVVCPGFVNLHSHSDSTILAHNNAENCLAMGLTTELVGSCGGSAAPLTEAVRDRLNERKEVHSWSLMDEEIDWFTLAEWRTRLEKKGIGINVAPLVGHGTVRGCAMGEEGEGGERIDPTPDEQAEMNSIVEAAMEDGSFGLSTGLTYPPGRNALTDEIVELAKVVAGHGGVYSSHMRCEGDRLIEATREFLEICDRAEVRGVISHHKAMGWRNFGKVNETLRMVTEARSEGIDAIIDLYPWRHGGTTKSLGTTLKGDLPDGTSIQTRQELMDAIRSPEGWEKVKTAVLERREKELQMHEERQKGLEERGGWTSVPFFTSTEGRILHSPSHPELRYKSFTEVSDALGDGDFLDGLRALLVDDEGRTVSGNYPYSEEDIVTILEYPWTTVSTDQYAIDKSKLPTEAMEDALVIQNPRGYGTYPRILGEYVRDRGVLALEDAIRKMTSLPATFLGLQDRGIVREGFWGDLVIFDPETVASNATWAEPCEYPTGMPYVLVNGELAVDGGRHTGARAGRVLQREG